MFKLTGNIRQTRDSRAPSPQLRDDGTNFPLRMFFDENSKIVDADTETELIEQLLPGYLNMSDEERLQARIDHLKSVALGVQINIIGSLEPEVANGLSEWEYQVLFSDAPLQETYPLETIESAGDVETRMWESRVPLVLVSTDYVPHTDVIPPMSAEGDTMDVKNLLWMRPDTEARYLQSLSRIGLIMYGSPRVAPTPSLR